MLDPVGFWSYARQDDEHADGHLSHLRALVGKAIVLQSGVKTTLWQDIAAIPYGADWAATIERTIGQTTFFVPIVTPSYLKSPNCRDEFASFRRRMRELGRDNLIFPVHYVSVDDLATNETLFGDELTALRRLQWIDFGPLIFEEPKSSTLRRWAADLATSILKALRQPTPAQAGVLYPGVARPAPTRLESAVEDSSAAANPPPRLSSSQIRVLRALIKKPRFAWRSAQGVATDSEGLPLGQVRILLGELILMGLVAERQSKESGNLHYKLTARGAVALSKTDAGHGAS